MLPTLVFCLSLLVVALAIPPIIKVSFQKRLFDDPSESRKVHKRIVPNFGGVAIFTSFLFACSLFISPKLLPEGNMILAAGLILFMTGLKDDLVGLSPLIKFIAQFVSALIITIMANLRISDLHGAFGVGEISYISSVIFTVIFIVGIVNAYNLIDGIDGLAAMLGIIFSLSYSILFYQAGELGWSYLSLSLAGGLVGFLFFNLTPAKIFMGDSGSLILGFLASIFTIKFMTISNSQDVMLGPLEITSATGLVLSILIIPIFDTLRVFTLRIMANRSPFTADSNHLHHRLLFLGLSHIQSTFILAVCNVLFIIILLCLQFLGNTAVISILVATMLTANGALSLYIERYKARLFAYADSQKSDPPKKSFGDQIIEKLSEN